MVCGTVREIWRYPIKSMRGEQLTEARIGMRGIARDRGYALLDVDSGKIASAKHPRLWGWLLQCRTRIPNTNETISISLPDGGEVVVGRDDIDAILSNLAGHPVRLVGTPPETPEIERYWPDVDGLALRDLVTSGAIGQGAPLGTFFDYAPLHVLTTATLAHLRALYPNGQVDTRRFRPNLVIEVHPGTHGFVENEWVGRTLQIGNGVRLRITNPVPRCVVPTLAQGELTEDIGILRAVARHNRPPVPALDGACLPCLGVYAMVERVGEIQTGYAVR